MQTGCTVSDLPVAPATPGDRDEVISMPVHPIHDIAKICWIPWLSGNRVKFFTLHHSRSIGADIDKAAGKKIA